MRGVLRAQYKIIVAAKTGFLQLRKMTCVTHILVCSIMSLCKRRDMNRARGGEG